MHLLYISALVGTFVLAGCGGTHASLPMPPSKQVAITFDDAPVQRFYTHSSQWHRMQVIDSIAAALDQYGAPATVFAIGNVVKEEGGADLIDYWLTRGAELANHSMSHPNFNDLAVEEGTREIREASALLKPFAEKYGRPIRYFRFPYLAEGATAEQKAQWQQVLAEAGLRNAVVTISNEDWKYDAAYTEAELAEDWAERYEVGQAYLQHMREAVAHWDSVAVDLVGRDVSHVLLLHANRINRDYLGQILAMLKGQGFAFVSLDEAYTDPIYRERDAWVSANGTSFLEHLRQTRLTETP